MFDPWRSEPRVTISTVKRELKALVVDDDPQVCGLVGEILALTVGQ